MGYVTLMNADGSQTEIYNFGGGFLAVRPHTSEDRPGYRPLTFLVHPAMDAHLPVNGLDLRIKTAEPRK